MELPKPLIEALFELRWKLQEVSPVTGADPYYKIQIGRIYERVKEEYPFHEQLLTVDLPDEIAVYIIQHRFRKGEKEWPLIQIGPGITTVNDTEGYDWEDFEERISQLIDVFFETYPGPEVLVIDGILLRYINAIEFDYEKDDIFSFLREEMKMAVEVPQKLFEDTGAKSARPERPAIFPTRLGLNRAQAVLRTKPFMEPCPPMMKQSSRSTRPTLRSASILVLASILWSLLVIEVVLYFRPTLIPAKIRAEYFLSDSEGFPPGTLPDSTVGYKYAPNLSGIPVPFAGTSYTISTVSLGYPDIGFRDDGLNGEPFAIVLGDSLVACDGVDEEDCWVELLEQKTGQDFANLGVSGYGPDLQQRMLNTYGLPLKPKLIVWVFFANDMIQGWRFYQFGQGAVTQGEFWKNPVRGWLARHSSIYLTLSYFWYERYFYRNLYSGTPVLAENPTLAWWLAYTDLGVSEVAQGFERTQAVILDAYQQTHAELGDAEFVVVIVPFREQILYAGSEYQPVLDASNQALFDFCQQNKIPVIDITAAVKERNQRESEPMFYEDGHLTQRGNEIVAEILAQELREMLSQP